MGRLDDSAVAMRIWALLVALVFGLSVAMLLRRGRVLRPWLPATRLLLAIPLAGLGVAISNWENSLAAMTGLIALPIVLSDLVALFLLRHEGSAAASEWARGAGGWLGMLLIPYVVGLSWSLLDGTLLA